MEIKEIIEKLRVYTLELPKEALKEAIKNKDKITDELLDMLDYTVNNIKDIVNEKDNFFGYTYAMFLLAQFREKRTFPYLIELLNQGEDKIEYIFGDDFPEYISRLLASTYNGDDDSLFSIIENDEVDGIIRSCVLNTFGILFLNNIKDRNFIIDYYKKLIDLYKNDKDCYLISEIFEQATYLKLVELKDNLTKVYKNNFIEKEDIDELENNLNNDNYEINVDVFPLVNHYEFIDDCISIMDKWQYFRYLEDEEFEESDIYSLCNEVIRKRRIKFVSNINIGRNEPCICGSGKKFKKCCMNNIQLDDLERLDLVDRFVSKAYWYFEKDEYEKAYDLFRVAFLDMCLFCEKNNIKTISDFDNKYEPYVFFINWIEDYDEILQLLEKDCYMYDRIDLCDRLESIFEFNNFIEKFIKGKLKRIRANSLFKLNKEEEAKEIIENYLIDNPKSVLGYLEMADWYLYESDSNNFDLDKAEEILLRAEKISDIEDKEAIYERLVDIYEKKGDNDKLTYYRNMCE